MSTSSHDSNLWRHIYAGTSLAITILACTFGGIWVDRHWSIHPWGTLIGAGLGIAIGFYNFLREFLMAPTPGDSSNPNKGK